MEVKPKATTSVHATDAFDFVYGKFRLSGGWTIPYLATTMTFRQAKESLNLVSEFTGWEDLLWRLEELFQRDIDWPRVERKIVPYLSDAGRPRFFNSLTVALLPTKKGALIEPDDLEEHVWNAPTIEEGAEVAKNLGPITLGYYYEWESIDSREAKLGKIRWNKDETFCVAIDGQHRLAAIKEMAGTQDGAAHADVPVLLLPLHPQMGFRSPTTKTTIEVLRSLFIDLNKHAKPVSRTRLILLDDQDPTSLCTRACIGEGLVDGFQELEQTPRRLPLTLVDWHTDGAKVNSGPYIVAVLTLDWTVQKTLNTGPISDPMQHRSIQTQIDRLTNGLKVNLESAKRRLDECVNGERPFSYSDQDPDELTPIADAFRKVWVPSIVELFSEFTGYDRLIQSRRANGAHVADFSNWYQLHFRSLKDKHGGHASKDYNDLVRRWGDKGKYYESDLKAWLEDAESCKEVPGTAEPSLAYMVVFQKALVYGWHDFAKLDGIVVAEAFARRGLPEVEFDADDDQAAMGVTNLRIARLFVDLLNEFVDEHPQFMDLKFEYNGVVPWQGTLLKPDQSGIDFNEAAAIRGQDLLLIPVYLRLLEEKYVFDH